MTPISPESIDAAVNAQAGLADIQQKAEEARRQVESTASSTPSEVLDVAGTVVEGVVDSVDVVGAVMDFFPAEAVGTAAQAPGEGIGAAAEVTGAVIGAVADLFGSFSA